MENDQIMMKEKLGFLGIIKEALNILAKNPSFTALTLLVSFPFFCFLLLHELLLRQSLLEIVHGIMESGRYYWRPQTAIIDSLIPVVVSKRSVLWGFLCLVIGHALALFRSVSTVHWAALIYAGQEQEALCIRERLSRPFQKVGFKGPFITSIYALILASVTWTGLISFATQTFWPAIFRRGFSLGPEDMFLVCFGTGLVALLIKYLEWSAIWNMGLVISILEGKHGDVALGVSAFISRGNRKSGFLLMLVFFVCRLVLRVSCLYLGWGWEWDKGTGALASLIIGQIFLFCIGDVIKWVVCLVYYCDCKKRFLEKKVDTEQARSAADAK